MVQLHHVPLHVWAPVDQVVVQAGVRRSRLLDGDALLNSPMVSSRTSRSPLLLVLETLVME